jgi:osmotically inducible protein OsmC
MADAQSRAEAVWEGSLTGGGGTVTLASGVAPPLPVTWAARTSRSAGKTSPEELVAAAHASCYCMALSNDLAENGTPPAKLEVGATVTFANVNGAWKVTRSALTVRGTVPGLDAAGFARMADAAKDGCPISVALKNNIEITVAATLT